MSVTHLFDTSEYQRLLSVPDWHRLFNEQHRRYGTSGAAIVRIDYGDAHPDLHLANRATALQAGAKVLGLYQYGVDGQPIGMQAAAFIRLVGTLHPGEFAIFDLEDGSGSLRAEAEGWFTFTDAHLTYDGYHGGWLYSGEAFIGEHDLAAVAAARSTWVAAYGSREPTLTHALWQHTDGQIGDTTCQPWPLIGRVDCSIFHGTVDQLAARVWTPPKPKPQPTEDDMWSIFVDPRRTPNPAWLCSPGERRWLQDPAEEAFWKNSGLPVKALSPLEARVVLDRIPIQPGTPTPK